MMSGLMARSVSYPRPQLSRTPGEKPSATMSDMAMRRLTISRPFGSRTLSEMPRLPGFLLLNCPPWLTSVTPGSGPVALSRASRPPTGAIAASRVSGCVFNSILMLSAPNALRNRVPPADARNHEKSTMRMPCRGKGLPRFDGGSFGSTFASAPMTGVAGFGVFVEQRRAAADDPVVGGRDPLARGVTKRLAQLGMLDVGQAPALHPMWIHRVLVRLA